jgi:hypothetical protein
VIAPCDAWLRRLNEGSRMSSVGSRESELLRERTVQASVAAAIITILLAWLMNVSWKVEDCGTAAIIAVVPLLGGMIIEQRTRFTALSNTLVSLGLVITMALVGAALALLSTRTSAPIADYWLMSFDRAVIVSAPKIVSTINQGPTWMIDLLRMAYERTGMFLLITLGALHLLGRHHVAWRMVLIWTLSLIMVSLIAFAAPALGCFSQLSAGDVAHLPRGAGRYAMRAFNEFRYDTNPVLSFNRISGVVTFPSFHTVCAILVAQAWRGTRVAGPLATLLAGAIIFSCVPIGGHYLVDLLAGAAVWWAVTVAADRLGEPQVETMMRPISVAATA